MISANRSWLLYCRQADTLPYWMGATVGSCRSRPCLLFYVILVELALNVMGCEMDGIATLLKALEGVLEVEVVSDECRHCIEEIELHFENTAFLPISNLGIRCVLARDEVWVMLKDRQFRPPPRPTVYMVEELKEGNAPEDQMFTVEDRTFLILGEEVLPGSTKIPENARRIGDGFVFFPERRSSPKTPSYFLIPPIAFQELDDVNGEFHITHVVSVSPSALADQYIRTALGFPPDDTCATILIGFDHL